MKSILKCKYCAFLIILAAIAGCQDIAGPETFSERMSIKSISKWKVESDSDSKIARVLFKEFDVDGNLILQEDFSDDGVIRTKSIYSYDDNKSLEVRSSFNESGDKELESKVEYEYDDLRRVVKQINYSPTGSIDQILIFSYDNRGNVIKTTQTFGVSTQPNSNLNIDYTYNGTGELVERITVDEITGNLSRDSISYNSNQNTVIVYRFDSDGNLSGSISYFYNSIGNIISELLFDYSGLIKGKFIYEYEYHTNN